MKSAILQERQSPPPRATQMANLRKRPQTQSPQICPSNGPSFSSWTLDGLISNYTINGTLPAPLTPTLPPRFEEKKFEHEDNEHEDDYESNDSELDNIPSLLSPAPSQGSKTEPSISKVTTKAKPVLALGKASLIASKNISVCIKNKLSDRERPRLLVRISFKALTSKLKTKLRIKAQEDTHVPASKKVFVLKGNRETDFKPRSSWASIITDVQNHCDKVSLSDFFFSVVLEFDCIICSIIASEPEEKPQASTKPGVAERNWNYIHSSVPLFVTRIEKYLKANNVSDKMKSLLSFLVGILAIVRALLLKRINANIMLQTNYYNSKVATIEDLRRINDLRKQVVDNYYKSEDNFAQSQSFFTLSPPPATVFPHSWHSRTFSIPRPSRLTLSPSSDKYFLPLGSYSDLREAVAYLYSCVTEFSVIFGSQINGGVKYTLKSGQQRPR